MVLRAPILLVTAVLALPVLATAQSTRQAGNACCPCPGRGYCVEVPDSIGKAVNCDAFCSGSSGTGGAGAAGGDPAMILMQGALQLLLTPQQQTPEQAEAARQRAAALERERQERAAAEAKARQEKADRLDREAFLLISLLDAPFNPAKRPSTEGKERLTCEPASPQLVCQVAVCGGGVNASGAAVPVCCPAQYPRLNYCDCKCYPKDASFECMQFAECTPAGPPAAQAAPPSPPPEGSTR